MKPIANTEERRLKILRQHLFTSLNCLLEGVAKWEPDMIVGYGQGGLVAAMSTLPMVLEAACRTRVVTPEVLEEYRRSWGGVTSVVIIDPAVLPQRSEILELRRAVPEIDKIQPRSVYRLMISSKRSLLKEFAKSVGSVVGAAPESDLRGFGNYTIARCQSRCNFPCKKI